MIFFLAFSLGAACGVRSFVPLAVLGFGFFAGWLPPTNGALSFWNENAVILCLAIAAGCELFIEHFCFPLSDAPALALPLRILSGALAGSTVGTLADVELLGLVAGGSGAVIGSSLSWSARRQMNMMAGSDIPGSLVEDALVLMTTTFIVAALS